MSDPEREPDGSAELQNEASYRRGVSYAAEVLLGAIDGKLLPSDQKKLTDWFENDLRSWARAWNRNPSEPSPAPPKL